MNSIYVRLDLGIEVAMIRGDRMPLSELSEFYLVRYLPRTSLAATRRIPSSSPAQPLECLIAVAGSEAFIFLYEWEEIRFRFHGVRKMAEAFDLSKMAILEYTLLSGVHQFIKELAGTNGVEEDENGGIYIDASGPGGDFGVSAPNEVVETVNQLEMILERDPRER